MLVLCAVAAAFTSVDADMPTQDLRVPAALRTRGGGFTDNEEDIIQSFAGQNAGQTYWNDDSTLTRTPMNLISEDEDEPYDDNYDKQQTTAFVSKEEDNKRETEFAIGQTRKTQQTVLKSTVCRLRIVSATQGLSARGADGGHYRNVHHSCRVDTFPRGQTCQEKSGIRGRVFRPSALLLHDYDPPTAALVAD